FDPRYLRPSEVDILIGDPTNTQAKLGWKPSIDFEGLVKLMVDSDLEAIGLDPISESKADTATVRQAIAGIRS
ncbi:MAG: GDP-mannose 4,6-dehydratase, partial [Cyanobacteria bacterium J06626_26]